MVDINNKQKMCNICGKEYTSIHCETQPGINIYVCEGCIETAKDNFIWICMDCGKVYIRSKKMVIERTRDLELKKSYMLSEDKIIIQGIDMCLSCSPEGIRYHINSQIPTTEC